MPYVEDITEALIGTLDHTGGLPAQQLAGHAANLEFWVGEVRHALDVIDGYGERFKRLKEGERIAAERNGPRVDLFRSAKPLHPGISDHELGELRRRLIDSVSQVLSRCSKERLVSKTKIEECRETLGLNGLELKSKKDA